MSTQRGFILQASYRMAADATGRRVPTVQCYGRLEDGTSFLVRDDRQRPAFYVREADRERVRAAGGPQPQASDRRTLDGYPACRIELVNPQDVADLRDTLHAAGIATYEADVRFATRYLIECGLRGGCSIEGDSETGTTVDRVYTRPTLAAMDVTITPRVLSFDIETDARATRLLAISLYAPGLDEVLIVDPQDRPMPAHATRCVDEAAALDAFCERIRAYDPDVITGWNVIDFDLTVLAAVAARTRHALTLGRDANTLHVRKAQGYFGSGQAQIAGRIVLDGIDLLRGAFIRMDDYSLDAVARQVLGEGKALVADVRDRVAEILQHYEHDLPAFALYARTDARLAYQIIDRQQLIPLAFARSKLTGMTPDRVAASIASFDFLYLGELWRRGLVAPSVRPDDAGLPTAQHGGHVLEPTAGLHRHVWVFDFKSLYPSVIRTFNIDPCTYVADPAPGADLIRTPGGAFDREPGILPGMLDVLFARREAARQQGDLVASHAIKILMNSFYGVLGTPACRFYNPALANSITGSGREILLWSKAWFEAAGLTVLYGDTDSLFVQSRDEDPDTAAARGRELATQLTQALAGHIAARWRVHSRLELKFEKLYRRLFLPRARHSTRGASKRYVGLLADSSGERVEFVGMEVVRRDWTELAKQVQRELYQRLFAGEAVDEYLAGVVRRVRGGDCDALLVYRKTLRKGESDYTTTTPPHVVAARKSGQRGGALISYVITSDGAEPIDAIRHPLDREHYVDKQVRPVAEPVLATLGLDFEQVIGDHRQYDFYAQFDRR